MRWPGSLQRMVRPLFRISHERLFGIAKPKTTPMTMPILMPTGRFCATTPPIMPNVIPTSNQPALNLAARFGDLSFMFDGEFFCLTSIPWTRAPEEQGAVLRH